MFLPYWIGQAAWDAMAPGRRQAVIATMPAVAQFWSSVFAETKELDSYARVAVPTLLVRGTATTRSAREVIGVLSEILPNARIVEIDGAGHMVPLTHSEAVNAVAVSHIDLYEERNARKLTLWHRLVGHAPGPGPP
jgi:pimeloyl-ACP methyl ester carboxylesterase